MNKSAETTDNKTSKFHWFLVTVFIPTIFTLVVAAIVLTISDINILDKAKEVGKKVPYIAAFFEEEEPKSTSEQSDVSNKKEMAELEAKMADQQLEVEAMEDLLDTKDVTIQRNDLEKQQLEAENNELRQTQNENKRAYKDIIKTYESMSAKKSALIITNLNDEDAVEILTDLKTDTLASIIEQMDPSEAARLMKKLTSNVEQN